MACNTRLTDRAEFNELFGILRAVDLDFNMPDEFKPDLTIFGKDIYLKELFLDIEFYKVRRTEGVEEIMAVAYPKECMWDDHLFPVAAERGWTLLKNVRLKLFRVTVVKYCKDFVFRYTQLIDATARKVFQTSYWGTCVDNVKYIPEEVYELREAFCKEHKLETYLTIDEYQLKYSSRKRRVNDAGRAPRLNEIIPRNVAWVHLEIYLANESRTLVFLASLAGVIHNTMWTLLENQPLFDPFKKTYLFKYEL